MRFAPRRMAARVWGSLGLCGERKAGSAGNGNGRATVGLGGVFHARGRGGPGLRAALERRRAGRRMRRRRCRGELAGGSRGSRRPAGMQRRALFVPGDFPRAPRAGGGSNGGLRISHRLDAWAKRAEVLGAGPPWGNAAAGRRGAGASPNAAGRRYRGRAARGPRVQGGTTFEGATAGGGFVGTGLCGGAAAERGGRGALARSRAWHAASCVFLGDLGPPPAAALARAKGRPGGRRRGR